MPEENQPRTNVVLIQGQLGSNQGSNDQYNQIETEEIITRESNNVQNQVNWVIIRGILPQYYIKNIII